MLSAVLNSSLVKGTWNFPAAFKCTEIMTVSLPLALEAGAAGEAQQYQWQPGKDGPWPSPLQ